MTFIGKHGQAILMNEQGYVIDWQTWDETYATHIATLENLLLTEDHWQFIYFLRKFYAQNALIPPLRLLIKAMQTEFPEEKANSIYLHQLFPSGALKQSTKIAGLPKPRHCL